MRQLYSQIISAALIVLTFGAATSAAASDQEVAELLNAVAEINLTAAEDEQEAAYEALLSEVEAFRDDNVDDAKAWIAVAITRASYARTQGMSALGMLKTTRKELERAIELDEQTFGGYAHAFLGRLYFAAPAWPLSFGSDKKAKRHLERALEIDPNSLENQFYYALFMADQQEYEDAEKYFLTASKAQPIISGAEWRKNLDNQIEEVLQTVRSELDE